MWEIPTPALDPPVRLGLTFSVLKVVIICMKTIMSLHTILIISYLPALCQADFKILQNPSVRPVISSFILPTASGFIHPAASGFARPEHMESQGLGQILQHMPSADAVSFLVQGRAVDPDPHPFFHDG